MPGRAPRGFVLLAWIALVLAAACASERGPGVVHVVRPGETVWRISRRYGVSVDAIVRANGIRDVRHVRAGSRLWIPKAGARASDRDGAAPHRRRAAAPACPATSEAGLRFRWPLSGRLTSGFGRRHSRVHEGIDLAASPGTPVRAAEAGEVEYSGDHLGAYGKVVIVRHRGSWVSVYAHNRRNHVRRGQRVRKGQVIAEVGATGNATGPHLHFEIRRGRVAIDPLRCLP